MHGFGVGGHHYERNLEQLSRHFRVFALDLLGQGASWPESSECEPDPELGPLMYRWVGAAACFRTEQCICDCCRRCRCCSHALTHTLDKKNPSLVYSILSAEVWTVQLLEFLRDVAGVTPASPAYVAGNSLGGYLAVNLASNHQDLVKGVVLLNASEWRVLVDCVGVGGGGGRCWHQRRSTSRATTRTWSKASCC